MSIFDRLPIIDKCFSAETVEEILKSLVRLQHLWCKIFTVLLLWKMQSVNFLDLLFSTYQSAIACSTFYYISEEPFCSTDLLLWRLFSHLHMILKLLNNKKVWFIHLTLSHLAPGEFCLLVYHAGSMVHLHSRRPETIHLLVFFPLRSNYLNYPCKIKSCTKQKSLRIMRWMIFLSVYLKSVFDLI